MRGVSPTKLVTRDVIVTCCLFMGVVLFPLPAIPEATGKPLIFLGNQNLVPVIYQKEGQPAGLAVDIVKAMAQRIKRPVTITCMDWARAQELVARGEADALIQINPTEERRKLYDFSDPLLQSEFSIFTNANSMGIMGTADLRGLRIGVERGGLPEKTLRGDDLMHLVFIPNFLTGFRMLSRGELDAVVVDYRVGAHVLAENRIPGIRVSGKPIAYSQSAIAVRKGNGELLADINRALADIRRDGTYDRIVNAWKPKEGVFLTREQIAHRNQMIAIGALSVFCVTGAVWLFSLYRELRKRRLAETRLYRLNRELQAISSCSQALVRAEEEQPLLQEICRIICDEAGYRMAWVGYAEHDEAKTLRAVTWAGVEDGYLAAAKITWADTERGRGPGGTAVRTGQAAWTQDFATDPQAAPWREYALERGYRSCICLPLNSEKGKTFGVLAIYSTEPNAFTPDEVRLMEELAGDLAFGIMVLRARTERKLIEEKLHKLNEELETRVAERTKELERRNYELEQMNKVFVGRELRMVELKERIKALERADSATGDAPGGAEGHRREQ